MASKCMLTTVDNPFDPFEQFTSWFMFDEEKGYHTCSYLGRIARTSDQLSEEENELENERAIDEILKNGIGGCRKKCTPSVIAAVFENSPGVFFGECFYLPAVFNRAHKVD